MAWCMSLAATPGVLVSRLNNDMQKPSSIFDFMAGKVKFVVRIIRMLFRKIGCISL